MAGNPAVSDVVAALPLPALAIDTSEQIIAINDAAQKLLTLPALGRHFITALRQPAVVEAVERCLGTGKSANAQFLSRENATDTTYDVAVRSVPPADVALVTFTDITHVAAAGQMRRDFVANVSHELRTPLTALTGFIETLQGPARDDPAARDRFLDIMMKEAGRMNRLVGDLLSLSRVEADERVRPTAQIDLMVILNTVVRNIAPLATEAHIDLNADLPESPIILEGDADQLTQVFTNLIENAIKYGGRDKAVHIDVIESDHDTALRAPSVRVCVRDEGPGIAAVHLPRLTERFYRADSHRSRVLGGTGLGLAIVKHILNRHRGRLKVTSQIGQGSEFTVVLPQSLSGGG
ncbi:cell wall metabolism sensor histidine kinase WalK [Sulfitobacter sp. S190]|uniref:sensor histidine kinase n=1 Tax=Sulfitobacter sp. S190 TaxID=2867022 RepID=UPI0021A5A196|nr:ATP-binding protein [Sulfitobacter sp. S190]UWR23942.1 two-component sensor histidine kinase [Sulfitobacter sp. S190]